VLDVRCSPGTYIRSLAYDIGQVLGVGAHLAALERTRSGNFRVENAVELDTLLASDDWRQYLIAPHDGLYDWESLQLTPEQVADVQHGRFIPVDTEFVGDTVMAYTPDGHLLAVLERRDSQWKPNKVFLPQSQNG
jgi:tRNA pseudouridine55 synthase